MLSATGLDLSGGEMVVNWASICASGICVPSKKYLCYLEKSLKILIHTSKI
jgi:hypothetical protein